ncbi:MAG: AraC family transcriptional regulator, partial [Muribaculaceae bacterium]|nr:AraC family transcriptional regulator [Muribaculaceae bacterium]
SDDFQGRVLVLDGQFSFDAAEGIETNMIRLLVENPVAPIADPHMMEVINRLMDALEYYSMAPDQYMNRRVSQSLVHNIVLLLAEIQQGMGQDPSKRVLYTMADTYFRNFINMVGDNVRTEHEVVFYAEQLHITPKYLSEICKQKTGHKAKEIISAILLRSIKNDLLASGKSMKVLASEYGFADQSSLGKFFRKMTGLSPLHYKKYESGIRMGAK